MSRPPSARPVRLATLLLLAVGIPILPACADERKPRASAAEAAVRKVLDDQAAAWNKGDLDGFMAGYWNSPDLTFFSGGKVTRGWEATLERYRQRYRSEGKEMGHLAFRDLDVTVLGPDSAVVRGRFELELGKDKHTGLFTLLLRKKPEGWRIVHDHTSQ
jgi:beta-aspartyl-peptidase (threonine type)